ncbi:MAG: YqgE/AlgH family protein [Candidatus Zeuxoniibacter abyssi]|nr:MAG: YqgE/AlgH family protein [Candidatus Persebacteraceae bacterium AB1(2)]
MNLTNHFLISTGNLRRSIFEGAVIFICRHDSEGAFGLVVNKPSDTSVCELLDSLKVEPPASNNEFMVLRGGPVKQEQVFILHTPAKEFDVTIKVGEDIGVTLSRDILTAVSEGCAPEKLFFYFGYAGWGEGQLEEEVSENAWITIPASPEIIFDLPASQRLDEATKRLGFDISNLSDFAGHA